MPDQRVQDEKGQIHIFPDEATPEMIAQALGVKPPATQSSANLNLPGATPRLMASAQPSPSTQPSPFEQRRAPLSRMESGNKMAEIQLKGAGLPTSISNIPEWGNNIVNYKGPPWWSGDFWKGLAKAGPEQGTPEDTALGRLGTGVGMASGMAGAGEVRPGLSAAKSELAEAVRLPNNTLGPATKAISKAGGGLAGGAVGGALGQTLGPEGMVGGGYTGYRAGETIGPIVADKVLPGRPTPFNARGGAYSEFAGESPKAVAVNKGPGAYQGPKSVPKPNADPVAAAVKNRTAAWLPTKIKPAAPPAAPPFAEAASAEGVPGSLPKPSGRLVVLPEEAQSLDQMQKIATKRASEHGMQYAAGMRPAGGGRVPMTPTKTVTPEYGGARPSPMPWETGATTVTPPPFTISNAMGIRWAKTEGLPDISIPNGMAEEDIPAYVSQKQALQKTGMSMPWMKGSQ